MELNITSIRFKGKVETEFNEKIDWRKIEEDEICCNTYNNKLLNMIEPGMAYEDFFDTTLQAGIVHHLLTKKSLQDGLYSVRTYSCQPSKKEQTTAYYTTSSQSLP